MSLIREAVCTIVINPDKKVLVVSRGLLRPWKIGLPGGKREPKDNTLLDAAYRELKEETGVIGFGLRPVYRAIVKGDIDFDTTAYLCNGYVEGPFRFSTEGWCRWVTWDKLINNSPFSEYNRAVKQVLGL